jgi:hypothetical protein
MYKFGDAQPSLLNFPVLEIPQEQISVYTVSRYSVGCFVMLIG